MLGLFQQFGIWEALIVLAVIFILFGATRIPALARSLGKSVSEFKKGVKEGKEEVKKEAKDIKDSVEEKKD